MCLTVGFYLVDRGLILLQPDELNGADFGPCGPCPPPAHRARMRQRCSLANTQAPKLQPIYCIPPSGTDFVLCAPSLVLHFGYRPLPWSARHRATGKVKAHSHMCATCAEGYVRSLSMALHASKPGALVCRLCVGSPCVHLREKLAHGAVLATFGVACDTRVRLFTFPGGDALPFSIKTVW